MELRTRFGKNVKLARKAAGYSQEEFADISKMARSYMSDIERGQRNPTLDVVERVAKALNIAPERLLSPDFAPQPVDIAPTS